MKRVKLVTMTRRPGATQSTLLRSATISMIRPLAEIRPSLQRLEAAAVDAELGEIVLGIDADDERLRLLEIGAGGIALRLVVDRARIDARDDRRLTVVGPDLILEAGLPDDELALGET